MGPTVRNVISSCFGHVGERCFAVSNVLVVESVYDEFKERFIEAAKALKVGAGMDPGTELGPVVSKRALQTLHNQIEAGLAEGAVMLLDGRNPAVEGYPDGCFLGPTILEAEPSMEIFEEEAFGPVRCFKKVKDIAEAIEIINQNRYGHTACIYTETAKYARSFMERCNVGQVGINIGTPAPIAFYPVGGRKLSFFGSTRGRAQDAVDFYTDKKVVVSRWLRKLDFESDTDKQFPEWSPAAGLW
jgi:malonate-semialdehyde dehydrogenase (acetylating)/methylmalonate-semialdehyde dehydrogenase